MGAGHAPGSGQAGWDAVLQPPGAAREGAELSSAVKPQPPRRERGTSLASGPGLSHIDGLQCGFSAAQQREPTSVIPSGESCALQSVQVLLQWTLHVTRSLGEDFLFYNLIRACSF